jgi:hypothetical protein
MISTAKWNALVFLFNMRYPFAVTDETITYRTMRDEHTIGYLYLNGALVLTKSLISDGWHTGRSWAGHLIEDNCPCPQEPCGLINVADADPSCIHHGPDSSKTIRQTHLASQCPGKDQA